MSFYTCNQFECPGPYTRTMVCIAVGGMTNIQTKPNLARLKSNTRYRLSFVATRNANASSADPTRWAPGTLRFAVRQPDDSPGGAYPFKETVIQVPASGLQTEDQQPFGAPGNFSYEFTTPARDAGSASPGTTLPDGTTFTAGTNMFFMASPEISGSGGGDICLDDMSLTEVTDPVVRDFASAPVAVRVNQVGAGTNFPAQAAIANAPEGATWRLMYGKSIAVRYDRGSTTAQGTVPAGTLDADSGDKVSLVDFGPALAYLNDPSYWIQVRNAAGQQIAASPRFAWSQNGYTGLKNDALYFFYQQRSGEAITTNRYIAYRNMHNRPAAHKPDVARCFTGTDLMGNNWGDGGAGCVNYTKDVTGGWYDAADHGKYVVNGGVSLWTLQNLIERLQKKGKLTSQFPDNGMAFGIDGRSDLLNEAKHEMEFLLKMQAPAGMKMRVPVGYQAVAQPRTDTSGTALLPGPNGATGVYQVDLAGTTPSFLDSPGAVDFRGGKLPRLRIKLDLTEQDVGGMAFHAVHDAQWTGIPLNPVFDTQQRVLMYPTTAATLNLAAVAAQCYRIWKADSTEGTTNPNGLANRCLTAATTAWTKASAMHAARQDIFRYEYINTSNKELNTTDPSAANTAILNDGFALNPMFKGGGAYGDLRVRDEFYWAAMELYLATKDSTYATAAQKELTSGYAYGQYSSCAQTGFPAQCYNWISGFDWQNVASLGTLSALTADPTTFNVDTFPTDQTVLKGKTPRTNLLAYATTLLGQRDLQGYRFPKVPYAANDRNTHYDWGSNGGLLNRAIILGIAFDISNDSKYAYGTADAMNYLLGRNALGISYVSGYGAVAASKPHHRFWAKHAALAYPEVPPGVLVGGPNSRDIPALRATASRNSSGAIDDESARFFDGIVVPRCFNETTGEYKPQRCYGDDFRSFASNEVAINWNAPLLWVSSFLDGYKR